MNYRTVQLFDEQACVFRDEWAAQFREPEYAAFMLLLGDLHGDRAGSIAWQILEQRQANRMQIAIAEIEFHRRIFTQWQRYARIYYDKQPAAHVAATAAKLGVSAEQVRVSIRWIEDHGIPEAA